MFIVITKEHTLNQFSTYTVLSASILANLLTNQKHYTGHVFSSEKCLLQYAWCRLVFLEEYLKYYIQGCSIGLLHNVARLT